MIFASFQMLQSRPYIQTEKIEFLQLNQQQQDQILFQKQSADRLYHNNNYQQAINCYLNILQQNIFEGKQPQIFAVINFDISLCYKSMCEYQLEKEFLLKAIQIDPTYRKARYNLVQNTRCQHNFLQNQIEWGYIEQLAPLSDKEKAEREQDLQYSLAAAGEKLKQWGNKFLNMFGMSTDDFQVQKNPDGTMSIQMQHKQQQPQHQGIAPAQEQNNSVNNYQENNDQIPVL